MAVGFNLPDPYEAQKAEIARRQKYAETLQQQAFQPIEASSYQGIQAPIPATAALAKVLQGLGSAYLAKTASDEQRELREGDIKKGQEFAAALQGAKPEDRQMLALDALSGKYGQRAQGMAGPLYQMTQTEQEKQREREFRAAEAQRTREARAEDKAADRETKLLMANMMAQLRAQGMSDAAAHREAMLQLRAEGQRQAGERAANQLPVNVVTTYQTAATNERAASDTAQNMLRHVEDIKTGKLPLGPVANLEARTRNFLGQSSPESLRFADMMRDVEAAVNVVLGAAKGTQTEGDARRAREQILSNPNDERVVKDALEKLAKASQQAQNIYRNSMNQLGARYRGLEHERLAPIENAPPAGQPRAPGAPTPPATTPTPPGGQQPRPAPAGGQQPRADAEATRQQARDAIARGAPRDVVIRRLQEAGISPEGL